MVKARLQMRNVQFLKPQRFEDYFTLTELSREVNRDTSWLKQLERDDRIPKAHRVQHGELSIRLWSPAQVKEVKEILSQMKPGRPKNDSPRRK